MTESATSRTTTARLLAVFLAALVAMTASVALAPNAGADDVSDENRLFELTNQSRAQNGLGPLAYDPAAVGVARGWARELARSGQLRHNPNLVAEADAHITTQWTRLGENVGYSSTVDQVQGAYMNSPGHRANILGDYNRVGVGAVRDGSGRLWTVVVFLKAPALQVAPPPPPQVPASTFAPLPSAQSFAGQQFVDLLARSADASGLLMWTQALSTGSVTPSRMVSELVTSSEARQLVEPVNRLYWAYFHRSPDAAGVGHWVGRLRSGARLSEVSNAFAGSPEFASTYGSLSNQAFVELVYRNVLNRNADASGLTYWVGQLNAGRLNRGGVMTGFSESNEFKAATNHWNKVVQLYVGLLRRAPDQAGLTHWMGQLRTGHSVSELAAALLASAEYRNRF